MMDRETIMARIRALRQMTVGRGCTEAEAMAGDAVPLNHGVRTDGPAQQIGGQ